MGANARWNGQKSYNKVILLSSTLTFRQYLFTHDDVSRVSKASVCLSVCPQDKTKTAKSKIAKLGKGRGHFEGNAWERRSHCFKKPLERMGKSFPLLRCRRTCDREARCWKETKRIFPPFLSRVSILLLTRDIDIAILSVRLSVRMSVCLSVTRWYCMKTA